MPETTGRMAKTLILNLIILLLCSVSYAGGKVVYLVRWTHVITVPVPCPNQSKPDKYGHVNYYHGCIVNHMKAVKERKEKGFTTGQEADEFIEGMPSGYLQWCENPKKIRVLKHEKQKQLRKNETTK